LINTFLILATFGVVYLFVTFTTPVKAPPPVRVVEEVVETKTEAPAAEAAPAEAAVVAAVETHPVNIEKGKEIYLSTCIQCHNKDPNVKGPIGPELVDAPLEVMQVKVVTGRYPEVLPEGFVPKRKTKQMRKFPNLEKDVPSIHAYVQSLKK
jgi:mono/diheme cytochrome c family protein